MYFAYTQTIRDPLERAKDTVNWFAGREIWDVGTIYIVPDTLNKGD